MGRAFFLAGWRCSPPPPYSRNRSLDWGRLFSRSASCSNLIQASAISSNTARRSSDIVIAKRRHSSANRLYVAASRIVVPHPIVGRVKSELWFFIHQNRKGIGTALAKERFSIQRVRGLMSRAERYRQYAADCLRLAQSISTPHDKTVLVQMAAKWLRLAERPCSAPTVNAEDQSEP